MIRLYYSIYILLLISFQIQAQPQIVNATLPEVGDTLRTAFDGVPPSLDLGSGGSNQSWDLSLLQGLSTETLVLDASTGVHIGSFPTANQRVEVTAAQEVYSRKTDNKIVLLGFAGDDPFGFGLQSVLTYEPERVERELPILMDQMNSSSTQLQIAIAASSLPDSIVDQLPSTAVDSIRVTVQINTDSHVDAWGELSLPARSYEALRERRYEITNSTVEAKLGSLPWSDVTSFVIDDFPELAPDTSVTYYFWGDTKEPLAIVEVNANNEVELLAVTYKSDQITVDIPYISRNRVDLIAYPNPAVEEVRFDFRNLENGNYKLVIYNILGQEIWNNKYNISGNRTIQVDLENLRKGTYLYSLVDSRDNILTTKRLIVLKP